MAYPAPRFHNSSGILPGVASTTGSYVANAAAEYPPTSFMTPTTPYGLYTGAGGVAQGVQATANDNIDAREEGLIDAGLAVGEGVAWMAPKAIGGSLIGAPVATAFSAVSADRQADRGIEGAVNAYRYKIASILNINPNDVNEQALRDAAEHNKALEDVVDYYDDSRFNIPVSSLAGAAAGAAALLMPGGFIVALPVGFLTSWMGEKAAAGILGHEEEEDTPHGYIMDALKPKLESGQYLNAVDVFGAYVRKDQRFAEDVQRIKGDEWDVLDDVAKAEYLVQSHPEMLSICSHEAFLINSNAMPVEMVLFSKPEEIMENMKAYYSPPLMQVQQAVPANVVMLPREPRMQIAAANANQQYMIDQAPYRGAMMQV